MTMTTQSAQITTPADDQILITREFDAPRHLVWRASTEPDLVRRWWSAKRGTMTVCEIDLRVGGRWRYAMDAQHGEEVAFHGEFLEIVPDERLVSTEAFEGAPEGGPAVNTLTLAEHDGRTTLTVLMQLESQAVRDMILATGMEDGLQDAYDLLEEAAVSLK